MKGSIIFDAANKEHRTDYFNYLQTKSWRNSKNRYKAPTMSVTIGYIERTLLEHYSKEEFKCK